MESSLEWFKWPCNATVELTTEVIRSYITHKHFFVTPLPNYFSIFRIALYSSKNALSYAAGPFDYFFSPNLIWLSIFDKFSIFEYLYFLNSCTFFVLIWLNLLCLVLIFCMPTLFFSLSSPVCTTIRWYKILHI